MFFYLSDTSYVKRWNIQKYKDPWVMRNSLKSEQCVMMIWRIAMYLARNMIQKGLMSCDLIWCDVSAVWCDVETILLLSTWIATPRLVVTAAVCWQSAQGCRAVHFGDRSQWHRAADGIACSKPTFWRFVTWNHGSQQQKKDQRRLAGVLPRLASICKDRSQSASEYSWLAWQARSVWSKLVPSGFPISSYNSIPCP